MSSKSIKITSGIIAGTVAATAIGLKIKSVRKHRSGFQKSTARALNAISSVTHSLANMIG